MKHFKELNAINVNAHTEKKKNLTYLSWAWAWAEVKKKYPDANYRIIKFDGLPYIFDSLTGYMVYTEVTIEEVTHEMWLPVMDGANKAMKEDPYTYKVNEWVNGQKTGNMIDKEVEPATMFDINKTIMRCLTKNLAMFGLGLYIYAGEDIPELPPQLKTINDKAFKTVLEGDKETVEMYLNKDAMKEKGYQLTDKQIAELTTRLAVLKAEA